MNHEILCPQVRQALSVRSVWERVVHMEDSEEGLPVYSLECNLPCPTWAAHIEIGFIYDPVKDVWDVASHTCYGPTAGGSLEAWRGGAQWHSWITWPEVKQLLVARTTGDAFQLVKKRVTQSNPGALF